MSEDIRDQMIEEILTAENEMMLFVRAHMYLEHYVDLAIEKHLPHQKNFVGISWLSSDFKLRILHGIGFLSDVIYHNALQMGKIRNKFAHKLDPNEDRIKAWIGNMLIPWKPKEVTDAMDRFEIYKNVAITTILQIKNALEQDRNTDFYPDIRIPDSAK